MRKHSFKRPIKAIFYHFGDDYGTTKGQDNWWLRDDWQIGLGREKLPRG